MTVRELIEKLKGQPLDNEIMVWTTGGNTSVGICVVDDKIDPPGPTTVLIAT